MAARHRYLFLRYALLNKTTLNMQNNRYVTWYTFTFDTINLMTDIKHSYILSNSGMIEKEFEYKLLNKR